LFGIDPLVVLDATTDDWLLRIAALNVIAEDRKRQQDGSEV